MRVGAATRLADHDWPALLRIRGKLVGRPVFGRVLVRKVVRIPIRITPPPRKAGLPPKVTLVSAPELGKAKSIHARAKAVVHRLPSKQPD